MVDLRPYLAVALLAGAFGTGCGEREADPASTDRDLPEDLRSALGPETAAFPSARGKSLAQLVRSYGMDEFELVPATSLTTVGRNRFAFAIADKRNNLVFGPTVLYVADGKLSKPARGPFAAPAGVIGPGDRASGAVPPAVYSVDLNLPRSGRATVYAVTRTPQGLVGAATAFVVRPIRDDPVVRVGERSPVVDTGDTSPATIDQACTRNPPDSMHRANFARVIGKRPVALVIATPQFCESRVCGPVVDVAEQIRSKYGDQVEFIHLEVYNQNDPAKGLRASLRSFGVMTEPWLFTFDRSGRVAARLEGAFGERDVESAVRAAL